MSAHILIAEDEVKIARLLCDYVEAAGMTCSHVADGEAVVGAVAEKKPDLLVLDLMLPGRDGLSICRELRAASNLPIVMVTARVEEIDRLLGLELGADDYICKPFSPREVVARIKTILRRTQAAPGSGGAAPRIDIDQERLRVEVNGLRLDLTPVEFRLLHTLAKRQGRVFRREELLDRLYDDHRLVSDRTVDSHVKNLRRKLDAALPGHSLIHSVYGIGYKFELDG